MRELSKKEKALAYDAQKLVEKFNKLYPVGSNKTEKLEKDFLQDRIANDKQRIEQIVSELENSYEKSYNQRQKKEINDIKQRGIDQANTFFAEEKNRIYFLIKYESIRYDWRKHQPIYLVKCLSKWLNTTNYFNKAYNNHLLSLFIDEGYISKSKLNRGEWHITLDMSLEEYEKLEKDRIKNGVAWITEEYKQTLYNRIIKSNKA